MRSYRTREERDYFTEKDIKALHYILPIRNLPSVLKHGLLSHKRANRLRDHKDISNRGVQGRRANKKISRADEKKPPMRIHRWVNFYINPHNAMMWVKRDSHKSLCVLRIRREILARGDEMFSSINAAKDNARFFKRKNYVLTPRTKEMLLHEDSQGPQDWSLSKTDRTQLNAKRKPKRQAEVLFPYQVPPEFIFEIYTSNETTGRNVLKILQEAGRKDVKVYKDPALFFQGDDKYGGKFAHHEPLPPAPELTSAQKSQLDFDLPESSSDESEGEGSSDSLFKRMGRMHIR